MYEKTRRVQAARLKDKKPPDDYVVVDIETTGLSHITDEIIEIAALRVSGGNPVEEYHTLVRIQNNIPETIVHLTGITEEQLKAEGRELHSVLQELCRFLADSMLVCHNAAFDLNFIQAACQKENLEFPRNKFTDTIVLAKKKLKGIRDYKLDTVAEALSVDTTGRHRALRDCYITYGIYSKLNEK